MTSFLLGQDALVASELTLPRVSRGWQSCPRAVLRAASLLVPTELCTCVLTSQHGVAVVREEDSGFERRRSMFTP